MSSNLICICDKPCRRRPGSGRNSAEEVETGTASTCASVCVFSVCYRHLLDTGLNLAPDQGSGRVERFSSSTTRASARSIMLRAREVVLCK